MLHIVLSVITLQSKHIFVLFKTKLNILLYYEIIRNYIYIHIHVYTHSTITRKYKVTIFLYVWFKKMQNKTTYMYMYWQLPSLLYLISFNYKFQEFDLSYLTKKQFYTLAYFDLSLVDLTIYRT